MAASERRCLKCGGNVSRGAPPQTPLGPPEVADARPDGAVVLMAALGVMLGVGLGWLTGGPPGAAVGGVIGLAAGMILLSGGLC